MPAPNLAPSPSGLADAPPNLNARIAAAAAALRHTREQVVNALDSHLVELDALRRALANLDTSPMPAPQAAPRPEFKSIEHPPIERAAKPAPVKLPALPMMTQIIWPSKEGPPESTPMHVVEAPLSRPLPPLRPVSTPLVAYPAAASSVANADSALDHRMELATLEELNAALAYAFSHVSSARTPGERPDATHFVPASPVVSEPWPTTAKP